MDSRLAPPVSTLPPSNGRAAPADLALDAPPALARAERRAQDALDRMADRHAVLDRDFRFVAVNPAAERAFGIPRAEILGRTHWELLPASVNMPVADAYRRVMATGVAEHLTQHYVGEGRDNYVEIDAYPTEEGGIALFWRDVTERVRAEAALRESEARARESEARYRTLFETMREGFAVVELVHGADGAPADLRYVELNPALEQLTSHRVADVLGRRFSDVLGPEEARFWTDAYRAVVASGAPEGFEHYVPPLDRWFGVHATPHGADRVAVFYEDITERKQGEAALRASEARQAFLLALSDALRPLEDPVAIQGEACRRLGERLGADRAYYVEIDEAAGVARVGRDWVRDADGVSLVGEHRLRDFAWSVAILRRGESYAIADTQHSPLVPPSDRPTAAAIQLVANIAAPFIKGGRLVGALCVSAARAWTADEAALVGEMAERTWEAVERARTEAAVRASEEHNRGIVEAARDYAIFTTDAHGTIDSWSPGAEAVLGWTASDAVGQPAAMTYTPDDQAAGVPARELAEAAARSVVPEVRWHARKDGGRVFLEGTLRALRGDQGRLRGFLKVGKDVTERRRLDEALRASEGRFRALVDNLPDYAIFGLDARGVVTTWTPGAERVKGYTADEAVGLPLAAFYTPEDAAAGVPEAHLAEAAAAGRGEWEGWRVRKDGTRFWVNEIATAVREADGRVVGFTKISRDLTTQRRAGEALRASEAQLRAVANVVPDLLWQSAPDGTIAWYNDRWYAYTGQTPADAAGEGWRAAIHPDDLAPSWAAYQAAEAERRPFRLEYRLRGADGTYRWFLAQFAPLCDAAGAPRWWYGAAADVHEQRTALEGVERRVAARTAELARANDRLTTEIAVGERARAERNALLRRLAAAQEAERQHLARELHDEVGQHLTAVGLGLRALADVVPPGSEVDRRAEALRALVDTLGRELHALAVRLRPRALDDFGLEPTLDAYAAAWTRQHGIPVDLHARVQAERLAPAVESAVYRIVQEALTNVARHSGATRAGVVVERQDGHVIVTVEDNGRGFDADARTAAPSGAAGGLGLLGVRERATLLGGTVDVESAAGSGTTLFVRIPIQQDPGAEAGAEAGARGDVPVALTGAEG